jgi:hypothetical protein
MHIFFSIILMCASMLVSTGLHAEQESETGQGRDTEQENDTESEAARHPYFGSKYYFSLGAYRPQIDFDIQVDGSVPGVEINFDETVGISETDEIFSGAFRWNFGKKWSLWGQYFKSDQDSSAILTEDVQWEDITFKEGTNVKAGTTIKVARVFFGREFKTGPNYEFGAGLGLHWLEFGAFIEGEALIGDDTTGFHRGDVDASFPLPDIGAWYAYSFNKRWLFSARADWLSASFGDYSGSMTDVTVGIDFNLTEHIGINLAYYMFRVDVDIDTEDWHGNADLKFDGPFLSVMFTF